MTLENKFINVRGIPIPVDDVVAFEMEFGGMLFDESAFDTHDKKVACANVIVELDRYLRIWQEKNNTRELPEYLPNFPDKTWLYIPVSLYPPGSGVTILRTSDRPAGLNAWFRVKRSFVLNRSFH